MPHDCIPSCTVYTVVQILVDYYCCFHLTSGTSTAVGPSIVRPVVHRNRKRFLLSQSTLREEFVEKKFKSRGVLESVNHNIGAASACRSARSVQK